MDLDVSTTAKFEPAPATEAGDTPVISESPRPVEESPRERRSVITTIATAASRRWRAHVGVPRRGGARRRLRLRFRSRPRGFPADQHADLGRHRDLLRRRRRPGRRRRHAAARRSVRERRRRVSVEAQARPSSFVVFVEFEDSFGLRGRAPSGSSTPGSTWATRSPPRSPSTTAPINAAKFVSQYDVLVSVVGPPDATPADLQREAEVLAAALQDTSPIERRRGP